MSFSRVQALRAFAVGLGSGADAVGLGDFSPGVESARAAGIKVTRDAYALGDAGTLGQSIPMVIQKVREGRLDPAVRGWAGDILWKAGDPQGIQAKATAILNEFRAATVYAPDPAGAEYVASAAATLCLRPGLCIRARDCDCGCVAVGSALLSINVPIWVVFQDFGAGKQQHVLLGSQDEFGNKFYIDPSTKWPVGNAAPAVREEWFDPLDGLAGPEIIGVGWSPISELGLGRSNFGGLNATPGNDNATERHLVKRADGAWWEYAGGQWHREVGVGIKVGGSEVGVGSTGWEPAEWNSMKPVVHEIGLGPLCPSHNCAPQERTVGLTPEVGDGLAATPPPTPGTAAWVPTSIQDIQEGQRYFFSVFSDIGPADLQPILSDDWTPIESFAAGSVSGARTSYQIQAVAAHSGVPSNNGPVAGLFGVTKGTIEYVVIYVQAVVNGSDVSPNPNGTPPPAADLSSAGESAANQPDVRGINGPMAVAVAATGIVIAGTVWGLRRRSKKGRR